MAYSKTVWVNDNAPALNATNLNKIENGIYDNADAIDTINATLSDVADYVIEEGTNNSWSYRKWNNGTFEAWKIHPVSIAANAWSGGNYLYYSSTLDAGSVGFNVSDVVVTGTSGQLTFVCNVVVDASGGVTYRLVRNGAIAISADVLLYARGTYTS